MLDADSVVLMFWDFSRTFFRPEYEPRGFCSLIGMQVMHELSISEKRFGWRLCEALMQWKEHCSIIPQQVQRDSDGGPEQTVREIKE